MQPIRCQRETPNWNNDPSMHPCIPSNRAFFDALIENSIDLYHRVFPLLASPSHYVWMSQKLALYYLFTGRSFSSKAFIYHPQQRYDSNFVVIGDVRIFRVGESVGRNHKRRSLSVCFMKRPQEIVANLIADFIYSCATFVLLE